MMKLKIIFLAFILCCNTLLGFKCDAEINQGSVEIAVRDMIKTYTLGGLIFILLLNCVIMDSHATNTPKAGKQPNILFAIADDQSYPHASAYGATGVETPAFDRVAKAGILFTNAFVAAPQCSPSRAAILTGKNIWQLEEAGTHGSYFPKKFMVFTNLLENAGYDIGFTGKPWGPGNWKDAGWDRNPVGPEFNNHFLDSVPAKGIQDKDYFGNFKAFYLQKNKNKPFFFWYGGHEPHRDYEEGSGQKAGKKIQDADLPSFLPDDPLIRSDVLDYALEIEWFDRHLGKMLDYLEETGELENTLIVVTADNGMPFPAAKANVMEYGTHVPLAICWADKIKGNRTSDDLVSMIDLAPTFLQIAKVQNIPEMTGKSLKKILFSKKTGIIDHAREFVLTGRERHTHARPDNLGYPARAIRTPDYLYIRNFKPDRWPAGDPAPDTKVAGGAGENYKDLLPGYHDIDNSPTKLFMIEKCEAWPQMFEEGFAKRPAEQLYDIMHDPGCTHSLADDPKYKEIKEALKEKLEKNLLAQEDPRMLGNGDIFESYPRFGKMRNFPGFKERGKYNPQYMNE